METICIFYSNKVKDACVTIKADTLHTQDHKSHSNRKINWYQEIMKYGTTIKISYYKYHMAIYSILMCQYSQIL